MDHLTGTGKAPTTQALSVLRVGGSEIGSRDDHLAVEDPLEIRVSYTRPDHVRVTKAVSVTMRTPGHDPDLATGFLYTEGIVSDRHQIASVSEAGSAGAHEAGSVILVTLVDGVAVDMRSLERSFYTTSSCGVCGKGSIEALGLSGAREVPRGATRADIDILIGLPDALRSGQEVFGKTGGLHACGLFDLEGRLLCVREDVGRHNAVDKVIGSQLLDGRLPLGDRVLVVSGRASFELVQKAVMAGIPLMVAVGAPSSLAVACARRYGITLLGFAREGRVNVYTGAQRLKGLERVAAAG